MTFQPMFYDLLRFKTLIYSFQFVMVNLCWFVSTFTTEYAISHRNPTALHHIYIPGSHPITQYPIK